MEKFAFLLGSDMHQNPLKEVFFSELGILKILGNFVLNGELCWFCTLCCLFSLES